jgi:hypothetical protein
LSSRWTRCYPGVTKVVVNIKKFVLPSHSWEFDSEKLNYIFMIVRGGFGSREIQLFVGTSTNT